MIFDIVIALIVLSNKLIQNTIQENFLEKTAIIAIF